MREAIVNAWIISTRWKGLGKEEAYSLIPIQNEATVLSAVQGADAGLEAYFDWNAATSEVISPNPQVARELSIVAPAMARLYDRIKLLLYCVVKYSTQLLPPLCVPGSKLAR